jgi:hypothetical protein
MEAVVSPVLHKNDPPPVAVRVAWFPAQMELPTDMAGEVDRYPSTVVLVVPVHPWAVVAVTV